MPACKNCQKEFIIRPQDKDFYQSIDVPEPKLCPMCRRQSLLCWRNQQTLYHRKCDKTGKDIISIFAPNSGYTVYDRDYWWGDDWDPTAYGQDYDFSKPFFPQFDELMRRVPMVGIFNGKCVNSQYCNHVGELKNCYLVFGSWGDEDSMYSTMLFDSRDSVDTLECGNIERCYQTTCCNNCYNTHYSHEAENCFDSFFLFDCRGCNNCLGCTNLHGKQYCIFNQQYTEVDYRKKLAGFKLDTRNGIKAVSEKFLELKQQAIHRYALMIKSQNSTGNSLTNAKECHYCFNMREAENCAYCINGAKQAKDIYDGYGIGANGERGYYIIDTGNNAMDTLFCGIVWNSSFAYYCYNCHGCTEIFGCAGLRNKKFCILNKQYSESEYFELKKKIIARMTEIGEWGEFFPPAVSPFGYNETLAYQYQPLTKDEATAKNFKWQDDLPGTFGQETLKPETVPETIGEVGNDILKQILACQTCGKNYKIINQELTFYKNLNLPIPLDCPDCRYLARWAWRNPHQLWHRQCMCEQSGHNHQARCQNEFETTYSPDRPEKVYCEECYRKEIY